MLKEHVERQWSSFEVGMAWKETLLKHLKTSEIWIWTSFPSHKLLWVDRCKLQLSPKCQWLYPLPPRILQWPVECVAHHVGNCSVLNARIGTAPLLPDADFPHFLLAAGRKSRLSPCWWGSCSTAPHSEGWPSTVDLSIFLSLLAHRTSVAKASKFPSPGRSLIVKSGRYTSSAETCHQPSKCRTVLWPTGANRRSKQYIEQS